MHAATTADSGIYHCLITFYKWICGYLPRGSVTLVLCVKSYVFGAGTAAAGCQNVRLLCSSFLFSDWEKLLRELLAVKGKLY